MRFLPFLCFILCSNPCKPQDFDFARTIVDTLSSSRFWGRGYTNNGLGKTADFLESQYLAFGIKPLKNGSYIQTFEYAVNTFPSSVSLILNGTRLHPGKDFIIAPESRGIRGNYKLSRIDSTTYANKEARILVKLEKKLTWSVAHVIADYTSILIDNSSLQSEPKWIDVDVVNHFIPEFQAENICGMVEGTSRPDSMIVISAHYDHLGGMGDSTFFPGANDNASGIALLLNLAKFYSTHPQRYSMVFICFSGEEAGLLGSKYFTENPLADLSKIRFLLNIDIAGTGDEGITVVNATEHPNEYSLIKTLNGSGQYLRDIASRSKAANSDHYWFSEKGIPSFFIYTRGGIKAYHDIYDRPETLPLTVHTKLMELILKFNEQLIN